MDSVDLQEALMADSTDEQRLEHALGVAFRFLNRRDRTVAEMEAHLEKKGIEPHVVHRAVGRLLDEHYLDDRRFAERFAEDRRRLDNWGSERIAQRLASLGLDRDLVSAAVGRHDHHEELDAAVELLRRRYSAPPQDARERNRMLGVLLRKGYDSDLAYDALRSFASALAVD
jgi:regulatory protein